MSRVPYLMPIFGEEVSNIIYRSLEEQLHRAMATLFDQRQRHGVARLVGMRAPLNIVTPVIERMPGLREQVDVFLERVYGKLPFALRSSDAQKQIEERQQRIITGSMAVSPDEKIATRRRIQ